jgi:hypothetical protein
MIRSYIGVYSASTASIDDNARRNALGIDLLSDIELKPLKWPKRAAPGVANLPIIAQAQAAHGQLP